MRKNMASDVRTMLISILFTLAVTVSLAFSPAVYAGTSAESSGHGVTTSAGPVIRSGTGSVKGSSGYYEDEKESGKVTSRFYSQLASYSKKIYKFLNRSSLKKKTLKYKTSVSFSVPAEYVTGGKLNKTKTFIKLDKRVQKGAYAYRMDHMEKCYTVRDINPYYYYRYRISGGTADVTIYKITLTPERRYSNVFKDGAAVKKALSTMKNYILTRRASSSRYHTLYTMCKYMTTHFTYGGEGGTSYSPSGVLLRKYGNEGVCEAYSKVCFIMCKQLGIPVIYAESKTHAYNFVQMENGIWYGLDTSWIDDNNKTIPGKMDMRWFLYGTNQVLKYDQNDSHVTAYRWGDATLKPIQISAKSYKESLRKAA